MLTLTLEKLVILSGLAIIFAAMTVSDPGYARRWYYKKWLKRDNNKFLYVVRLILLVALEIYITITLVCYFDRLKGKQ